MLVTVAVLVSVTGVAVGAPIVRAQAHASAAQPACSRFLSTGEVARIAGVGTKPYGPNGGVQTYSAALGVPDGNGHTGNIPGTLCDWNDNPEPAEGLSNTARLIVGYGESPADWAELVAYFRAGAAAGFPAGFSDTPKYTRLKLGGGTKAFLTTVDLAKYYQYTPGEFPGVATYLYAVTVLTAHHNVLQVWFANASAATTKTWVKSTLVKHPSF